jgi:hypothetical protein
MVMKQGTTLVAPALLATPTCGFTAGLVPPTAGWAWQPEQLSMLKVGPNLAPGTWNRSADGFCLLKSGLAVLK